MLERARSSGPRPQELAVHGDEQVDASVGLNVRFNAMATLKTQVSKPYFGWDVGKLRTFTACNARLVLAF